MFPYDPTLLAAVQTAPQSPSPTSSRSCRNHRSHLHRRRWPQVVQLALSPGHPGRPDARQHFRSRQRTRFADPAWIAALDVAFARLYFAAIQFSLSGANPRPAAGRLSSPSQPDPIARIQFALAGMNAHINHDLPQAVLATCQATVHCATARHHAIQRLHRAQLHPRQPHRSRQNHPPRPSPRRRRCRPSPPSTTRSPPGASPPPAKPHGTTPNYSGTSTATHHRWPPPSSTPSTA
jgi:hypothetical protein